MVLTSPCLPSLPRPVICIQRKITKNLEVRTTGVLGAEQSFQNLYHYTIAFTSPSVVIVCLLHRDFQGHTPSLGFTHSHLLSLPASFQSTLPVFIPLGYTMV